MLTAPPHEEEYPMRASLILMSVAVCAGCAATYVPPTGKPVNVSIPSPASRIDLMRAARQVLAMEGYQIASADDASGVISTLTRTRPVSPDAADCGANVGVENAYLKDPRTSTRLAVNVIVRERSVTVRATVDADYRPGSQMQDMTLTCISKGTIERALAEKIIAEAAK